MSMQHQAVRALCLLQCRALSFPSKLQLNPVGYKAAAGAANQLNAEAGATVGVALGYEIILTFILVFVVFAATDTKRALMTAPLPVRSSTAAVQMGTPSLARQMRTAVGKAD